MDFITDLPTINAFDSILVVVDQGLTKGVILIPCNKNLTSEDTVMSLKVAEREQTKHKQCAQGSSTILRLSQTRKIITTASSFYARK